jgi:hypothetical protein
MMSEVAHKIDAGHPLAKKPDRLGIRYPVGQRQTQKVLEGQTVSNEKLRNFCLPTPDSRFLRHQRKTAPSPAPAGALLLSGGKTSAFAGSKLHGKIMNGFS